MLSYSIIEKYLLSIYSGPIWENKPGREISDPRMKGSECQHKNLYINQQILGSHWRQISKAECDSFWTSEMLTLQQWMEWL